MIVGDKLKLLLFNKVQLIIYLKLRSLMAI